MDKNINTEEENGILYRILNRLDTKRTEAPRGVFAVLLVLYFVTAVAVSATAGSQEYVTIGSMTISFYMFAGVLSSFSNLCLVLMVVFCGQPGFIASVAVLLVQFPMLILGIVVKGNITSVPGIFVNLLTVCAVIAIHLNYKKIEEYQTKLSRQATTDLLTGLPNGFASTKLIADSIKTNKPFAAVTIDINGFKRINDTMGFDMGNKALVEVATRWEKIVDDGLSGTKDFLSRINGDEFSLVIRDFNSEEDIVNSIKVYEAALNEKINIDGYEFMINASFGYSLFPDDSDVLDSLISDSVAAMKEVKRINSSEHILRFTPELNKTQNQLIIDNKVRDAIENDRVFFNLQPQYDISHRLRGFEVLARMKDSYENPISPVEFIPAVERMGLIDSLDLMIYKKSTEFFGDLLRRSGADITLSINVSVKHLMKSGFIDEIRDILKRSKIPAKQLEIEITESIMIESAEKATSCLNELRDMGIGIAIDDFGTGYSSLSYLNSIPLDILKIDKSFIDPMNTSESSKKYVEAIISLAHVLDLKVIAEGVEEPEQIETLNAIGCDYIQGFIWGRPLPKEEAEKLVQ